MKFTPDSLAFRLSFVWILLCGSLAAKAQDPVIEVAGWYNDGWEATSHTLYLNNHTAFSTVNPFWYNLGTSDGAPGKNATDGSIYERTYVYSPTEIAAIRAKKDLFIPAIGDMNTAQINDIMSNKNYPNARQNLINNLLNTAINRGYDGWDLDFELGAETGNSKTNFTAFANDLADSLAAHGKVLDITIGAMSDATIESYWLYDLAGLATCRARRIKIMCYDNNLADPSQPSPVAPMAWVRTCLDYMVTTRGIPAQKILLGLGNYGWVYKQNTTTGNYEITYPFQSYNYITGQTGFQTWWDNTAKENYAEWTNASGNYLAYYADKRSVSLRMDLVNEYHLAGLAFWVLGREQAAIYDSLRAKFPSSGAYTGTAAPIPGTIQAENFDIGGNDTAYYDTDIANKGGQYRPEQVDIETCSDAGGGYNLSYVATGEWLRYKVNVTAGTYRIEARVAAPAAGGQLRFELNGTTIGTVNVTASTGGWQTWQTVSVNTSALTAGTKTLRIYVVAGGLNLNYVNFVTITPGARIAALPVDEVAAKKLPPVLSVNSYPNPFTQQNTLSVNIPAAGQTDVSIFTAGNRQLKPLYNGYLTAGMHQFSFDGAGLPAGIYIYVVTNNGKKVTGKIVKQ